MLPAGAPRGERGFSTACNASRRCQSACARAGCGAWLGVLPAFRCHAADGKGPAL